MFAVRSHFDGKPDRTLLLLEDRVWGKADLRCRQNDANDPTRTRPDR